MHPLHLMLFTAIWTAVWLAPLPKLSRRAELAAGLIPFLAFSLRVFAGFFAGVPADDAIKTAVQPLLDWVNGQTGLVSYQVVLDATVTLGLVWLATAFGIPRQSRIATAWIMPAVAGLSLLSLQRSGEPLERLLSHHLPAVVLGAAAGGMIAAVIRFTPSPLAQAHRQQAALCSLVTVPTAVALAAAIRWLVGSQPAGQAAQVESLISLAAGIAVGSVGCCWGGFTRTRSRLLFGMAIGVAAGGIVKLYSH